jgi:monoamine oxidase
MEMHSQHDPKAASSKSDPDILILGAGIAGLAAARTLAQRGLRVLVLEAKDRVGGRILTHTAAEGTLVELGAEFVHGRDPALWKLIEESGVHTTEREGSILRETFDGRLIEDEDIEHGDLFQPLEILTNLTGPDLPFSDWLRSSDVPEDHRPALLGYVEGFNAADAKRISSRALGAQQKAEDNIEGARAFHIRGGYSQLTDFLTARTRALEGEIILNCTVQTIDWSSRNVRVETNLGTFQAPQCIITLPLGVLQCANRGGDLRITPEPPQLAHARRLAMGHAARFTMLFREPWWHTSPHLYPDVLHSLSFLFTSRRTPPVWWTTHPERQPLTALTGWAGGPAAQKLTGRTPEDLARSACNDLAEVFSIPADQILSALISTHTHDWTSDPHSLGVYSYIPAGALDAPIAMAQPEASTLFFAGEHTDVSGHWGTVHAALRSGRRAAAQMIQANTFSR